MTEGLIPVGISGAGLGASAELMLGYDHSKWYHMREIDEGDRGIQRSRWRMPSPHLERKLKEALGDDAGEEAAVVIDRIDPIRGDIAELRHHMELTVRKAIEEQTRFFFVAWALILAAIVGLYSR